MTWLYFFNDGSTENSKTDPNTLPGYFHVQQTFITSNPDSSKQYFTGFICCTFHVSVRLFMCLYALNSLPVANKNAFRNVACSKCMLTAMNNFDIQLEPRSDCSSKKQSDLGPSCLLHRRFLNGQADDIAEGMQPKS